MTDLALDSDITPLVMRAQLKAHVEAIASFKAEKSSLARVIRERYALAKSQGFDARGLDALVSMYERKRMNRWKDILKIYMRALGAPATE